MILSFNSTTHQMSNVAESDVRLYEDQGQIIVITLYPTYRVTSGIDISKTCNVKHRKSIWQFTNIDNNSIDAIEGNDISVHHYALPCTIHTTHYKFQLSFF